MVRMFNTHESPESHLKGSQIYHSAISLKDSKPFPSEYNLVEKFGRDAKSIIPKSIEIITELDAGNGIADIAVLNIRSDWKKYSNIISLKPQWVYPLISLPYRKLFDLSYFLDITCASRKTAAKILRDYEKAGFCKSSPRGWIKMRQPRPPVNDIYAIEAKIRDWKRALYQATRYQDYANQSWVLLDHHYSNPAIQNKEEFRRRGVGLMTINQNGNLITFVNAANKKPKSDYRYWYAMTEALRRIVKP